ncbi:MAG: hypothetical protein K6T30_02060 [Alicyclobacillus sp.]|nr:hypothetical protein [Alicyclobacillus sp.]
MKFEYRPVLLAAWVASTQQWRRPGFSLSVAEDLATEEELRKEFVALAAEADVATLVQWLARKPIKVRRTFPKIFLATWSDTLADRWASCIRGVRTDEWWFQPLLAVCHGQGDRRVWPVVQEQWRRHRERLASRLRDDAPRWEAYLQSDDPAGHLGSAALQAEARTFSEVMQQYEVPSASPWFWAAFQAACARADQAFFLTNKETFEQAMSTLGLDDLQGVVDRFILVSNLAEVDLLARMVHQRLGDPRLKPELWHGVQAPQKEKFSVWLKDVQLREVFAHDNERYQFWQHYLPHIDQLVIIDHHRSLVLFSPNVVVLEGLGTAQATYIYHRSVFESAFANILPRLKDPETALTVRREHLRNPDLVVPGGRLSHYAFWQYRHSRWLYENLGWEAKL